MKTTEDYKRGGATYEAPDRRGFMTIEVLPQLTGRMWDEDALNLVHALRPSSIRVSTGEIKCDSRTWRVTVYVDDYDVIMSIEQEVEVGLVGRENGADLRNWMSK